MNDTQDTIKSYDIKTEILALLLTFIMGFISLNVLNNETEIILVSYLIIIGSVISLLTIICMGMVLYPRSIKRGNINLEGYTVKNTYYISRSYYNLPYNFNSIFERIKETDWQKELLYELLKKSLIRDRKRKWFIWSIFGTGLTAILAMSILTLRICTNV